MQSEDYQRRLNRAREEILHLSSSLMSNPRLDLINFINPVKRFLDDYRDANVGFRKVVMDVTKVLQPEILVDGQYKIYSKQVFYEMEDGNYPILVSRSGGFALSKQVALNKTQYELFFQIVKTNGETKISYTGADKLRPLAIPAEGTMSMEEAELYFHTALGGDLALLNQFLKKDLVKKFESWKSASNERILEELRLLNQSARIEDVVTLRHILNGDKYALIISGKKEKVVPEYLYEVGVRFLSKFRFLEPLKKELYMESATPRNTEIETSASSQNNNQTQFVPTEHNQEILNDDLIRRVASKLLEPYLLERKNDGKSITKVEDEMITKATYELITHLKSSGELQEAVKRLERVVRKENSPFLKDLERRWKALEDTREWLDE